MSDEGKTVDDGTEGAGTATATETTGADGLSIDEAVARMTGEKQETKPKGEAEAKVDAEAGEAGKEKPDGEQKPEEKEEDDAEEGGRLPEKYQKILEREIGRKVAKFHEKEEQLQSRIEELERGAQSAKRAAAGDQTVALDAVEMTPEQLDAYEDRLQGLIDFCEMNPDGYEADPEDKNDRNLSAEQIRKAKVMNSRLLRQIPALRQMQVQRTQAFVVAEQEYPNLKAGAEDRKIYDLFCEKVPGFRRIPNGLIMVGDMLAGERARQAKKETASGKARETEGKKPAPIAKPLPGTASGKKPSVAKVAGESDSYTVAQMVADGGTIDAAARLMMEREKKK